MLQIYLIHDFTTELNSSCPFGDQFVKNRETRFRKRTVKVYALLNTRLYKGKFMNSL
jgi:hypothetical protein